MLIILLNCDPFYTMAAYGVKAAFAIHLTKIMLH